MVCTLTAAKHHIGPCSLPFQWAQGEHWNGRSEEACGLRYFNRECKVKHCMQANKTKSYFVDSPLPIDRQVFRHPLESQVPSCVNSDFGRQMAQLLTSPCFLLLHLTSYTDHDVI